MKALKIIGVILVILLAIFLIVPFFLANQVIISEHMMIKAKPATLFNQVNTLHNWDNWSPFHKADTAMTTEYSGPEKGVGSTMSWLSKTMGDGSLTIAVSTPYTYIKSDLLFQPEQGAAIDEWFFEPQDEGIEVTWTTTLIDLDYPMGRYMGLMAKTMMKPFMTSGLNTLKEYCESLPISVDITMVDVESVPSLSIMDATTVDGIGELLGKNYGLIMEYMKAKKIDMAGIPYTVYYNWDPNGVIHLRAAIPVSTEVPGRGVVEYFELPATKAVFAKHVGGHDTGATHEAIGEYISDFGIETDDFVWEVYVIDSMNEPDESKWETDIYYPLK